MITFFISATSEIDGHTLTHVSLQCPLQAPVNVKTLYRHIGHISINAKKIFLVFFIRLHPQKQRGRMELFNYGKAKGLFSLATESESES